MAWAKTTDIGCGVASCPIYGLSIVCNYGPGGNWNREKPYEVKSLELCPKMENIPKDSFQTMRDNTQRAPFTMVNINPKLSSTGSSGRRVNDQHLNGQRIPINNLHHNRRNRQRISMSRKKIRQKFSKIVRGGSGHGFVQGQHNGKIVRHKN
ncbi:unnamed protein product [Schistosoma margrebowiei]|uniref:Uncharacterized protein n=1 Tax=Schistosoma margrebowiei TaxID=48269 RepID=A0A183MAI8_9TREM|nr:unnamed protein product [Schistosoma margrebowiei]